MTNKRQCWVIGNWKQNHLRSRTQQCAEQIVNGLPSLDDSPNIEVGIAPTYVSLDAAKPYCHPTTRLQLFAQDIAAQDSGAFTGEVGPSMLKDAGVHATIVGHSERRQYFGETEQILSQKLTGALQSGMTCVYCVGEGLESRKAGTQNQVVLNQLEAAFSEISVPESPARLLIAYEPVWAIGTGLSASPSQASEMHAIVRKFLEDKYGAWGRDRSIIYGGSVKPDNAAKLLEAGDVDGFLVGGASLDPTSFLAIVRAAASHTAR